MCVVGGLGPVRTLLRASWRGEILLDVMMTCFLTLGESYFSIRVEGTSRKSRQQKVLRLGRHRHLLTESKVRHLVMVLPELQGRRATHLSASIRSQLEVMRN